MSIIGDRIRKIRLAGGWGQAELARRAGMSPQQLNNIERGRRSHLRFRTVDRLAEALGIPMFWFTTRDPEIIAFFQEAVPTGAKEHRDAVLQRRIK